VSDQRKELVQGTLDMLILRTLLLSPNHGIGVSRRLQQITGDVFEVKPGSLFPALHRLEERGWLQSEWGESENNRKAKYYRITAAGRRQLRVETEHWEQVSLAIARALKAT
jgi:transcriptional regulator